MKKEGYNYLSLSLRDYFIRRIKNYEGG